MSYGESDLIQIVLFLAVSVITAKLTLDEKRILQIAMTDDLTGLHNLRSFEERATSDVAAGEALFRAADAELYRLPGQEMLMAYDVQVYGADWCGLTRGVREFLMNSRIPYDYYDVDQDPRADEFVRAMNDGRRHFPVVVVEEELIMDPTLNELRKVLMEKKLSRLPDGRRNGARIRGLLLESV